jgi:hypothetical protein
MSARGVVAVFVALASFLTVNTALAQSPDPSQTAPAGQSVEKEADPIPAHTGWATLVKDVGHVPGGIMVALTRSSGK